MRKPNCHFLAPSLFLVSLMAFSAEGKHSFVPKDGFVPNAETAISIAVAVWNPIYGGENIARQKPYRASLGADGVWLVSGSLPKDTRGGVAEAMISKADGRILRVSHGR